MSFYLSVATNAAFVFISVKCIGTVDAPEEKVVFSCAANPKHYHIHIVFLFFFPLTVSEGKKQVSYWLFNFANIHLGCLSL